MPKLSTVAAVAGLIASLSACAPPAQKTPQTDVVLATDEVGVIRTHDPALIRTLIISATPAQVRDALLSAYNDLGVDVKFMDSRTGEMGNKNFARTSDLAGVPLSRYLDCGLTQTGPGADMYRITMSLVSQVTPVPTGSKVETQLSAHGENFAASKGAIACETRGTLEKVVNQLVAKHLGG
jgi:hypothetical protein